MVLVDDSHAVGFVGSGPGHARAVRGHGPRRHHHRHPRQGPRGRLGRVRDEPPGGRRPAAPASPAVPVLELGGSRGGAAGSLAALDLVSGSSEARETLRANSALFRELMTDAGFELLPGSHPITPVMFPGEDGARQAAEVADHMLAAGVYVVAFSLPAVPRGRARIRVQLSAAHSEADVREASTRSWPRERPSADGIRLSSCRRIAV